MQIRLPLAAALALTVLAVPATADAASYVPGEVIVKYRAGTDEADRERLEQVAGTDSELALPGGSEQVAIDDGESVRETLAELRDDPNVAYAVPNYRAHASALPNDPGLVKQWNFLGSFGIGMEEAWALAIQRGAPGGRGALVALLDSGVAFERRGRYRRAPDLRRSTFVKGYDFVGRDRHPNDVFGHGTHVAGTIAQTTNNGVATAGIAYRARIMPLRVLDWKGSGDSVAISRAIRYAARRGADVINLSLEFPTEVRASGDPRRARRAALRAQEGRDRGGRGRQPGRRRRGIPGARRLGDRRGSHHRQRLRGRVLERGRRSRRGGAGRRHRRPQRRQPLGRWSTAGPTSPAARSTSRRSPTGSAASACPAATRARRWRART